MGFVSLRARAVALIVATAGGCAGADAFATTTYHLDLSGTVTHVVNCWELPDNCPPDQPPPPDQVYAWTGQLDLAVASSGDGTFKDPGLVSVDFVSNVLGFSVPWPDPQDPPDRLFPFYGSVTILGGRVTSFDGSYWLPDDPPLPMTLFAGLSVTYHDDGGHHTGPTDAVGTLAMAVPEPSIALMLLAGVAGLAACRRRTGTGCSRTRH